MGYMNPTKTVFRWSDAEVRASDIASLERTPILTKEVYVDRPAAWLDSRHGADCLSPRETLGHLIEGEIGLWIPRARHILQSKEESPFEPFDVTVGNKISYQRSVEDLVDEFARLRAASLLELERLQINDLYLGKIGIHPKFGRVTLDELLSTWVAHDLYHLGQIFKAFAAPFQASIGPWQEFLNLPNFN